MGGGLAEKEENVTGCNSCVKGSLVSVYVSSNEPDAELKDERTEASWGTSEGWLGWDWQLKMGISCYCRKGTVSIFGLWRRF